jgi:hypothetical protein
VAPVAEPGGAETTLLRLLRALAARGWSVTLTAPGPGRLLAAATTAGHATETLELGGLGRRTAMGEAAPGAAARFSTERHADTVERLIAPRSAGTVAA